jgi:hypothetical protein
MAFMPLLTDVRAGRVRVSSGVVEDAGRQHAEVPAGVLGTVLGQAPDWGHFGTGVGDGNGNNGQMVFQCNGFAQADRRAAADRDAAVGVQRVSTPAGIMGYLDRDVHASVCQYSGGAAPQGVGGQLAEGCLSGGAEHKHTGQSKVGNLVGQPAQCACAECHPHRQCLVREGPNHDSSCCDRACPSATTVWIPLG